MKRALALLSLTFCEPTGFEPEYVVDTLRVLGVQADEPLAAPGDTAHFTTLWADPLGNGRPISWAWGTCLNPGSTQIPDCAAALTSLTAGTDSFVATVPPNALDGLASPGELGVIFAACAGTLTLTPNAAVASPVTCTDGAGNTVGRDGFTWGGMRVVLVPAIKAPNPTIDKVFFDGNEWPADYAQPISPCGSSDMGSCPNHTLTYTATADSIQTYDLGNGPEQTELVGWFYVSQGSQTADYAPAATDDAGAVTSPPTFTMSFAATQSTTEHPIVLWLVLRNNVGGITFAERHFGWQ